MLRVPPEVEILGLDISAHISDVNDEQAIIDAEREYLNSN
jgi:hypothetical protein